MFRTRRRAGKAAAVAGFISLVAASSPLLPMPRAVAATAAPTVAVTSSPTGGYWTVTSTGAVTAYGGATLHGSLAGFRLATPIIGMASTADGNGYWLVSAAGGTFAFGDARYLGSLPALHITTQVVGVSVTPDGAGYWMVSANGGVFSFGDARFEGSRGGVVGAAPIVAMASTGDGRGYWLVTSAGGVFSYGDAAFYGSEGGRSLASPVVSVATSPDRKGYWLATAGGDVFAFGDAGAYGSGAGPVAGIAPTPTGYVLASSNGQVQQLPAANPLTGDRFWVNPYNDAASAIGTDPNATDRAALTRIAAQPTATWLGEWNADNQSVVNGIETAARAAGQVPVFVLYAIPDRDCGSYSSGGYTTDAQYQAFVGQVAAGIAGRPAVVVIEPDAISVESCLSAAQVADRLSLLHFASTTLSKPGTSVYLDAGSWVAPATVAQLLIQAGIAYDAGFSVNVSAANATTVEETYGASVSAAIAAAGVPGRHFVIDTSRNGNGMAANAPGTWCNLPGLALGPNPTAATGNPLVDAFLWVKYPGESDGTCSGAGTYDRSAPASGVFWPAYAIGLAEGSSP